MLKYLFLCCLLAAGCRKSPSTPGVQEYTVTPSQTDAAINGFNNSHYAYIAADRTYADRLLVFLPGTGAEPKNYRAFAQHAANLGFHAVGLMYPNEPAINQVCAGSKDITAHSRARLEIIDGTDRHSAIQVNAANSIINRLVKLLTWLHQKHPSDNWGQYLDGSQPAWNRIIIAGHSQGGGHAGVIGKHYPVQRVILFSAIDFLSDGQIPDWVNNTAGHEKYYALHHTQDELLDFEMVKDGWEYLGMGAPQDASSHNNAHALSTNANPAFPLPTKFHNMTVVDIFVPKGKLDAAWTYLLGK
jgi:pimeloyl-ACP methyl ester carboxylesterase